jgi:hypothetical protein
MKNGHMMIYEKIDKTRNTDSWSILNIIGVISSIILQLHNLESKLK